MDDLHLRALLGPGLRAPLVPLGRRLHLVLAAARVLSGVAHHVACDGAHVAVEELDVLAHERVEVEHHVVRHRLHLAPDLGIVVDPVPVCAVAVAPDLVRDLPPGVRLGALVVLGERVVLADLRHVQAQLFFTGRDGRPSAPLVCHRQEFHARALVGGDLARAGAEFLSIDGRRGQDGGRKLAAGHLSCKPRVPRAFPPQDACSQQPSRLPGRPPCENQAYEVRGREASPSWQQRRAQHALTHPAFRLSGTTNGYRSKLLEPKSSVGETERNHAFRGPIPCLMPPMVRSPRTRGRAIARHCLLRQTLLFLRAARCLTWAPIQIELVACRFNSTSILLSMRLSASSGVLPAPGAVSCHP